MYTARLPRAAVEGTPRVYVYVCVRSPVVFTAAPAVAAQTDFARLRYVSGSTGCAAKTVLA